jgi:hypothetical protein
MRDLSIVTDTLIAMLRAAWQDDPQWGGGPPPFTLRVSGQHPEQPGTGEDCDLNLYLFHVSADKYQANTFWTQQAQSGGATGQQPVAFEPLGLNLWYILSAQSKTSYTQEQLALSSAMRAMHQHGTLSLPVASPAGPGRPAVTPSEVSLVLESPGFDELSRLWQALGVALRTTAQYRVSVAFLTPEALPPAAPPVQRIGLAAVPGGPPDPSLPRPLGTTRTVSYTAPSSAGAPAARSFEQSPASIAPDGGQVVMLDGLGIADTDRVLLVSHDAAGSETETDITATWKVAITPPYPSPPANGVPVLLRAPAAGCPPPGRYELRVARPSLPGWRSAGVPLNVAPWLDPAGGPLIHAAAGAFTVTARNVPPDRAELRLGTVPLRRIADGGTPAAGEWGLAGASLSFAAPGALPAGQYPVRLRVADIEADPGLWAVIP